jgi:hypothetical protein
MHHLVKTTDAGWDLFQHKGREIRSVVFFFFCTVRAGIFFVFSQTAEFFGFLEPDTLADTPSPSRDEAAYAEALPSCEV